MRQIRRLAGIVAVCLAVSSGALPTVGSASSSRVPATCRATLHFDEAPYGLLARGVKCSFARHWAVAYQRSGRHPLHWSCNGRAEFTEEGSCQDRRSDDYFLYYIED